MESVCSPLSKAVLTPVSGYMPILVVFGMCAAGEIQAATFCGHSLEGPLQESVCFIKSGI